jgi:quercetin dioxygenase-like cupin family protein
VTVRPLAGRRSKSRAARGRFGNGTVGDDSSPFYGCPASYGALLWSAHAADKKTIVAAIVGEWLQYFQRRAKFMKQPEIPGRIKACPKSARVIHGAMFPYIALADDKSWEPGPYPGVELKILHRNETTGGVVVLRKFHANQAIPAHTHPMANEWAWILSGEWEEGAVTYRAGTLFHAPREVRHGPHFARTEVISLTVFDGPLTVEQE